MMNEYLSELSAISKRTTLYFRLESESSIASEEDSESVNSIQNKETDLAEDTPDTDSYFEYEVASLSGGEIIDSDSSSGSDAIDVTEEVIAAVLGDTSLEAWAADGGEDSCTSTDTDEVSKTDFWTCAQCKSKNNNPRFRLCQKCFQVRKNFNPPRPRKRKVDTKKDAVNVDNLRSCLNGFSQDSGVGSSQEFPTLNFSEIKVTEQHLNKSSTSSSGISIGSSSGSSSSTKDSDAGCGETNSRKRKASDCFSDNEVRPKKIMIEGTLNPVKESSENIPDRTNFMDFTQLCITCNNSMKDGIFLHGKSAHACCCYKCAMKTWKATQKCPICNRRIRDVVKLYF